jgi:type IV pilus assembly protein PilV
MFGFHVPADRGRKGMRERLRGVGLVEVLVASVVLSIGLLGLAGLQASGLRVGLGSIHRGQAAQLAYDIVERIRVNMPHATAYALAIGEEPEGTSLAARDLHDWRLRLRSLPGGTGSIAVDGAQATVTVQWDDSRGAGALRGTRDDDAARQSLRTAQFVLTAQLSN